MPLTVAVAEKPPNLVLPPSSSDTAPPAPVYGSTRADSTPGGSTTAAAARNDPHNPHLNEFLKGLDLKHVYLKTTPPENNQDEAVTDVYFDLENTPYSGPLVLFAVRPGGGAVKGTVTGLTLVTVLVEKGSVVGLEMNDPAFFTPDDPSDLQSPPGSEQSND